MLLRRFLRDDYLVRATPQEGVIDPNVEHYRTAVDEMTSQLIEAGTIQNANQVLFLTATSEDDMLTILSLADSYNKQVMVFSHGNSDSGRWIMWNKWGSDSLIRSRWNVILKNDWNSQRTLSGSNCKFFGCGIGRPVTPSEVIFDYVKPLLER